MSIDWKRQLGFDPEKGENVALPQAQLQAAIDEKLADYAKEEFVRAPIDERIQAYLDSLLGDMTTQLPVAQISLEHFGLAREMAFPKGRDEFKSDIVNSYRLRQGVLHNPKNDKRTTKGVFHVAEGGLPIAADKKAVPLHVFAQLLQKTFENTPASLLRLPYTAESPKPVEAWVSNYLRPMIAPEVPGVVPHKSMEIRFVAPGSLVSNLDFVESVFGNAGCAYNHDAAMDVEHWSGHTGCVILAPHLTRFTKKELGLPHYDKASERQKRDGMCWKEDAELYNDGAAFKITSRDETGVVFTIIADNYYGYCKKEVKTQISYAANLWGNCEEEHAGGALTFAAYDLGEEFSLGDILHLPETTHTYPEALKILGEAAEKKPEGYAIDNRYSSIIYLPEETRIHLHELVVEWQNDDANKTKGTLKLQPGVTYVLPSGYKVEMKKPGEGRRWRLIGTVAEPCMCHKPSTVSGGGKSEISKPIADACITGPVFVMDFRADMEQIDMLLNFDYSQVIHVQSTRTPWKAFKLLDTNVSLGAVIRLFTPSKEYTDGYNDFIRSIPPHIIDMLLVIKRYYKPSWEADWKKRFSVDLVNGIPGHELKYQNQKIVSTFLRVGYEKDGSWRTLGVRKDFHPSYKIQMEDDITASTVLPRSLFEGLGPADTAHSLKFVGNCEYRLFQRPDDAIIRGYDKQTERDMTRAGNYISNYLPLTKAQAKEIVEDVIRFEYFTPVMQDFLRRHAYDENGPAYAACPAYPRMVDGVASKNTRYLQNRPDLIDIRGRYLAEVGIRLARRLKPNEPVHTPVAIVVPGRRNNPPEKGVKALCAFNPIHYMELPELFMEFISSMTGKSPSMIGAGSEGAMTKGPFNALLPIVDLNAAYVSAVLTQSPTFVTSTAYVGPYYKVEHDISLLIPEIFARMTPAERDPKYLIKHGFFERCRDFPYKGTHIRGDRLGWRMTAQFERVFFCRVFNSPGVVLTPEMLRPELQDKDIFAEAVQTIVQTHEQVARQYFEDGSINLAIPPLKALLNIMAYGQYEGKREDDPEFRKLFTIEALLSSDWYQNRLVAKQSIDVKMWQKHLLNLQAKIVKNPELERDLKVKMAYCQGQLAQASAPEYLTGLKGTLGAPVSLK